MSSIWNPTLRKAPSLSTSVEDKIDEPNKEKPRKPTHFVHKANTIGIPSEADLNSSEPKLHSPSRTRLNIFDGFRKNTLRSKIKSDTVVLDATKEGQKEELHRRWSEANQPTVIDCLGFIWRIEGGLTKFFGVDWVSAFICIL